jgi:hypothetical protein
MNRYPRTLVTLAHNWLGLFPWLFADPYVVSLSAETHLIERFTSAASFQARGFYLPEQLEAIDLLQNSRKQIPICSRRWLRE